VPAATTGNIMETCLTPYGPGPRAARATP